MRSVILYMYIVDFNECKDTDFNKCHEYAHCKNVFGTYLCSCFKGFIGNGKNCEGNSVLCLKLNRVNLLALSTCNEIERIVTLYHEKNRLSNSLAKLNNRIFLFTFFRTTHKSLYLSKFFRLFWL